MKWTSRSIHKIYEPTLFPVCNSLVWVCGSCRLEKVNTRSYLSKNVRRYIFIVTSEMHFSSTKIDSKLKNSFWRNHRCYFFYIILYTRRLLSYAWILLFDITCYVFPYFLFYQITRFFQVSIDYTLDHPPQTTTLFYVFPQITPVFNSFQKTAVFFSSNNGRLSFLSTKHLFMYIFPDSGCCFPLPKCQKCVKHGTCILQFNIEYWYYKVNLGFFCIHTNFIKETLDKRWRC